MSKEKKKRTPIEQESKKKSSRSSRGCCQPSRCSSRRSALTWHSLLIWVYSWRKRQGKEATHPWLVNLIAMNPPDVVIIPTSGGFCLLSVFAGSVQIGRELLLTPRYPIELQLHRRTPGIYLHRGAFAFAAIPCPDSTALVMRQRQVNASDPHRARGSRQYAPATAQNPLRGL